MSAPPPNKFYVFPTSSYSVEIPPSDKSTIQYVPSNVDLFKYRANLIETKNMDSDQRTEFGKKIQSVDLDLDYWDPEADNIFLPDYSSTYHQRLTRERPQNSPTANILSIYSKYNPSLIWWKSTLRIVPPTDFAWFQEPSPNGSDPGDNWINSLFRTSDRNPSLIRPLLPNNNSLGPFVHFKYDITTPILKEENTENAAIEIPTYNVEAHYNFMQTTYENVTSNFQFSFDDRTGPGPTAISSPVQIPEYLLPNYYTFLYMRSRGFIRAETISFAGDAIWNKLLSLNGQIENLDDYMGTVRPDTSKDTWIKKEDVNYFTQYSQVIQGATPGQLRNLRDEVGIYFKNQIIPFYTTTDELPMTDVIQSDKKTSLLDMFPAYCVIEFPLRSVNQNNSILSSANGGSLRLRPNRGIPAQHMEFLNKSFATILMNCIASSDLVPKEKIKINLQKTNKEVVTPFAIPDIVQEVDAYDIKRFIAGMLQRQDPYRVGTTLQSSVSVGITGDPSIPIVSGLADTIPLPSQNKNYIYYFGDFEGFKHFNPYRHSPTRDWMIVDYFNDTINSYPGQPDPKTGISRKTGNLWEFLNRINYNSDAYSNMESVLDLPPGSTPENMNETLFFQIEKWEVDTNNNPAGQEPIQSIFVANNWSSTKPNFTFYDTQVKFGKKYFYRVYSYDLIYGTEYEYQLDSYNPSEHEADLDAEICALSKPYARLLKLPYFEKLVQVSDKPPMSPDVKVVQYEGDKNKVLFMFSGNTGKIDAKPVLIKDSDEESFARVRKAFNLDENALIPFKSDDPSTHFEVFRLDKKPHSYQAFKSGFYKQVTAGKFNVPEKKAGSASFVDNIQPNKKYYYTFRSIDAHGNVSNPSPIYEVEISYDGASPFLLLNILDQEPQKIPLQHSSKDVKKYLRIRPAYSQTLLNEDKSGLLDDEGIYEDGKIETLISSPSEQLQLGTDDEGLWSKTFKIRLISKKSGKKIDFNVKFETKTGIVQNNSNNNT